jgi:hypothetical protein
MKMLCKPIPRKEILNLSHHNTLFSQTLSLIPRHVFQKLKRRHKTGRSSRKFGFKEQFTVMAFIQLAARRSMRDGLRCLTAGSRLYHWGLKNVARLKQNAVYKLLERRPVNRKSGVISDHIIEVRSRGKALRLRRIGYRDPKSDKHYDFLTNHFRLAVKTIADIYKDRWQIEFFSGKSSRICASKA